MTIVGDSKGDSRSVDYSSSDYRDAPTILLEPSVRYSCSQSPF